MEKCQRVLSRDSMGEVKQIVDGSKEMLDATFSCDGMKVAAMLEKIHDREIPFLEYNDENAICQIKQKNYMQKVEESGEILLVGISYGKDVKCKHRQWVKTCKSPE